MVTVNSVPQTYKKRYLFSDHEHWEKVYAGEVEEPEFSINRKKFDPSAEDPGSEKQVGITTLIDSKETSMY